jgi:predicted transcriptional regulator
MKTQIKTGSLNEFFAAAKQTARAIDNQEKLKESHTIWMEIEDLVALLKPQRTQLLVLLRQTPNVQFSELVKQLHRSPRSVLQDIKLFEKYQLVHVLHQETTPIIQATFGAEKIELIAKI